MGIDFLGIMMMTEEDWDLAKIAQLQRENKPPDAQRVLLAIPALTPRPAVGVRINERYELYRSLLKCPGTRTAIVWKVARAVEEGRIEESRIASIFSRLELASNRGAYFVACVKGAFLSSGLSWFEEEWTDA